jgi:mRNA-degrading endonuclease toxin of MazEF toxin-antitoxin module
MNPPSRGELWLADLGPLQGSREQLGRRPVIILQTDDLVLNTIVGIPMTSTVSRVGFANIVFLPAGESGQDHDSAALCHQILAIDCRKLIHKIGDLAPERLNEIEVAVAFVLGLPS